MVVSMPRFSALSWPTVVRISSGAVALWSAVQAAHLAIAMGRSAPSPTAQLLFGHNESEFFYSLLFHAFAVIIFGLGALFAGRIGRHIASMPLGRARIGLQLLTILALVLPALTLLIVFNVSEDHPQYQIFVDASSRKIVRRDVHLLPSGITEESISFRDIRVIEGKMIYSGWWGDRYILRLVTRDWRRIEIARGTRGEEPKKLYKLAQAYVELSGAKLDMGSKLPRLR